MPIITHYIWCDHYKEDWNYVTYEKNLMERYARDDVLCVSSLWTNLDSAIEKINSFLNANSRNKVILFCLVDPVDAYFGIEELAANDRILEINNIDFWYWLELASANFLHIDPTPTKFKYTALCYQRKPSEQRSILYSVLKNFDDVIVTKYGQNLDAWYNQDMLKYDYLEKTHRDERQKEHLPPHDIYSLGHPQAWQESFLNIVSETAVFHDHPFYSEKSAKPLIGKRPFLVYGRSKSAEFFNSHGFETFNSEFGYDDSDPFRSDDYARRLADIVRYLQKQDLHALYQELLPKIEHNYNQIDVARAKCFENVHTKINNFLETT